MRLKEGKRKGEAYVLFTYAKGQRPELGSSPKGRLRVRARFGVKKSIQAPHEQKRPRKLSIQRGRKAAASGSSIDP